MLALIEMKLDKLTIKQVVKWMILELDVCSMIMGAKVWPLSWIQAIEHAIGPLILSLENNLSFAGAIVS